MSSTRLPNAFDVTNLLASLPQPVTLPVTFPVGQYLADAVAEWSRLTRYRPFFQTNSTPIYVNYDPPGPMDRGIERGGNNILRLKNGLLTVTNVWNQVDQTIGVAGGSGNLLIKNSDYFLAPANAPSIQPDPEPFTEIQFTFPQIGGPQSIVVQAVFGYCTESLPDDAFMGIVWLTGSGILEAAAEGMFPLYSGMRDDDQSVALDPSMIGKMGSNLKRSALKRVARFQLFT